MERGLANYFEEMLDISAQIGMRRTFHYYDNDVPPSKRLGSRDPKNSYLENDIQEVTRRLEILRKFDMGAPPPAKEVAQAFSDFQMIALLTYYYGKKEEALEKTKQLFINLKEDMRSPEEFVALFRYMTSIKYVRIRCSSRAYPPMVIGFFPAFNPPVATPDSVFMALATEFRNKNTVFRSTQHSGSLDETMTEETYEAATVQVVVETVDSPTDQYDLVFTPLRANVSHIVWNLLHRGSMEVYEKIAVPGSLARKYFLALITETDAMKAGVFVERLLKL